MIKRLFPLAAMILLACLGWTQADSEISEILAEAREHSELDSLLYYYHLAYDQVNEETSDSIHYLIVRGFTALHARKGHADSVVHFVREGEQLIHRGGLSQNHLIDLYLNEGVAYMYAGDLGNCLIAFQKSNDLAREKGLDDKRLRVLNNLGAVYRRLGRSDDALAIYADAYGVAKKLGNELKMGDIRYNEAAVFSADSLYDETLQSLAAARKHFSNIGNTSRLRDVELSTGYNLYKLGRHDEALEKLKPLLEGSKEGLTLTEYSNLFIASAGIYLERSEFDKALTTLTPLEEPLMSSDLNQFKQEFLRIKGQSLFGAGKHAEAYENISSLYSLQKRVTDEKSIALRAEMETQFMTREKELQLALQESEIERGRSRVFLLSVILGVLALLLGSIYILFRQRNRSVKALNEKNKIITKALSEKEVLLKEIHHRVKNNLQVVSALLTLQSRYVKDKSAIDALRQGQQRVDSMALIHRNLYQHDNLVGVDTKDYFEKLSASLVESYQLDHHKIVLDLDVEPLLISVDTMIPLGLIVNELITNSLKYAFKENQEGIIRVSLKEQGDVLTLSVEDSGVGPGKNSDSQPGFGHQLVHSLVKRLDGELETSSEKGFKVTVSVGKYKKTA